MLLRKVQFFHTLLFWNGVAIVCSEVFARNTNNVKSNSNSALSYFAISFRQQSNGCECIY